MLHPAPVHPTPIVRPETPPITNPVRNCRRQPIRNTSLGHQVSNKSTCITTHVRKPQAPLPHNQTTHQIVTLSTPNDENVASSIWKTGYTHRDTKCYQANKKYKQKPNSQLTEITRTTIQPYSAQKRNNMPKQSHNIHTLIPQHAYLRPNW